MYTLRAASQFLADVKKLGTEDRKLPAKVWDLITDVFANLAAPLSGLGKPEALRGNMAGYYSRRITDKHRLIYRMVEGVLELVSCYGHYDDK